MASLPLAKWLFYYLWIVPHLLLAVVGAILVRRRLLRSLPWFSTYIFFQLIEFGILFPLAVAKLVTADSYFRLYVTSLTISTVLRYGVIMDATFPIFRKYPTIEQTARSIYSWSSLILLVVGLALAWYSHGHSDDHLWFVLNTLGSVVLIFQTGLLLTIFLFFRYLHLAWRNQSFGVALGIGMYAAVELVAAAIRSATGFTYTKHLDYLTMAAYHCSVVIWILYLRAPAKEPTTKVLEVAGHHEVEAWNEELERLLHQ